MTFSRESVNYLTMNTRQDNSTKYGDQGFVLKWVLSIILAMALVFVARFFDYQDNPTGIFYPPIALIAGIVTILVLLYGAFFMSRPQVKTNTMQKRRGVMFITLGIIMLACFFMFKEIMPLIF